MSTEKAPTEGTDRAAVVAEALMRIEFAHARRAAKVIELGKRPVHKLPVKLYERAA